MSSKPTSSTESKAAVPAVSGSLGAHDDKAVAICEVWLNRYAEHETLIRRWQALETELFSRSDWRQLDDQERSALAQTTEMNALIVRIESLHAQNEIDLATVSEATAPTLEGLISKLSVALAIVPADENEAGHALLQSILNDVEGRMHSARP